jgi:uncharacterized DUF497 family protein
MKFEWDPKKASANRLKHGIDFETAQLVWDDPFYVLLPDRIENGEERWHAIGMVRNVVLLVVVHTFPDPRNEDLVRIIGARKVSRYERKQYEEGA